MNMFVFKNCLFSRKTKQQFILSLQIMSYTVGKQSPWWLSFVYTSYVSVPVETALKLGKQIVSFHFYNLTFDTYTIICGVK